MDGVEVGEALCLASQFGIVEHDVLDALNREVLRPGVDVGVQRSAHVSVAGSLSLRLVLPELREVEDVGGGSVKILPLGVLHGDGSLATLVEVFPVLSLLQEVVAQDRFHIAIHVAACRQLPLASSIVGAVPGIDGERCHPVAFRHVVVGGVLYLEEEILVVVLVNPHLVPFRHVCGPVLALSVGGVYHFLEEALGQLLLALVLDGESRHGEIHLAQQSLGSQLGCAACRRGFVAVVFGRGVEQMFGGILQVGHYHLFIDILGRRQAHLERLVIVERRGGDRHVSEISHQVEVGEGTDEASLRPVFVLVNLLTESHVVDVVEYSVGRGDGEAQVVPGAQHGGVAA